MSGRDLQESFHFTGEDLAANRAGQLSEEQNKRVSDANKGCIRIAIGLTIILAVATLAAFFLIQTDDKVWPVGILLVLTVLGIIGSIITWRSGDDSVYLFDIEGVAELRVDRGDEYRRYSLSINGYDFTLDLQQYETLEAGKTYRVFYTTMDNDPDKQKTASKLIQSLEPIQS